MAHREPVAQAAGPNRIFISWIISKWRGYFGFDARCVTVDLSRCSYSGSGYRLFGTSAGEAVSWICALVCNRCAYALYLRLSQQSYNVKYNVTLVVRISRMRWPNLSFHIASDYCKGRSKAKQDCLVASMVALLRRSPRRPPHSSRLNSRPIIKKDVESKQLVTTMQTLLSPSSPPLSAARY